MLVINVKENMVGVTETFNLPMIDLDTVPRHMTPKMPVDFATYLLSSSPPATNLELLSYAFSHEPSRDWAMNRNREESNAENTNEILLDRNIINKSAALRRSLKPIIIKKEEGSTDTDWTGNDSASSSGRTTPTSPCSPGKLSKKVSFADHKGYALATVKIMAEPSDQPPKLGPEILKSITKGVEAECIGLPPFKLDFAQPASDYMAFREKVEKDCVSLENAILRDYNLVGTIKVKNISFEKKVLVRYTFNNWETHTDVEARFVSPVGVNLNHSFDTFSFELDISAEMDPHNIVQFAVCFETATNQHWDNNGGKNYQIVPTDFNTPYTKHTGSSTNSSISSWPDNSNWTEYNCWRHVDTSTPYY